MRTVIDHKLNGLNDALTINVLDEPGQGGANHEYEIGFIPDPGDCTGHSDKRVRISFQNGPILEADVNGISGEALLAIVIDRLRSFQAGQYACNENMHALVHAVSARDMRHWLLRLVPHSWSMILVTTSCQASAMNFIGFVPKSRVSQAFESE